MLGNAGRSRIDPEGREVGTVLGPDETPDDVSLDGDAHALPAHGTLLEGRLDHGLVLVEALGEDESPTCLLGHGREQGSVGVVAVLDERGSREATGCRLDRLENLRTGALVVAAVRHEDHAEDRARTGLGHATDESVDLDDRLREASHSRRLEPAVDGRFDRLEVGEGRDGLRFEQGAELATAGEPDDGQGVLLRDELGELLLELCPNLGQLAVHRAATVDDEDVVGGGLDRLGRGCRIDGLTNQEQLVRDLVRRLAHGWVSLTF